MKKKIVIAGAGPAGLLLAHDLVRRRDSDILILEKRSDPKRVALSNPQTLRSFPIALNQRGLMSLAKYPGLLEAVEKAGIYLTGICLHHATSGTYKPPRVIERETPSISVDRNRLTLTLLNELEKVIPARGTKLMIQFDAALEFIETFSKHNMQQIRIRVKTATGSNLILCDHLVAADGANSYIRQYLVSQSYLRSIEKEIPDDYRTIFLSRLSSDGKIRLDSDKLHGWIIQNQGIKLISAPVIEQCVSGALIFDKGKDPLTAMTSVEEVLAWFHRVAPSLAQFVTKEEAAQLLRRPASTTIAVRCNRLSVGGKVLLLGDAAHSMSASVGQGCNSALQDVQVFAAILDENVDDWTISLDEFTASRMEDIHAVSEMSDYSTPRSWWMKREWLVRTILRKLLPTWIASLVLKPLPMELLMETSLPYKEVYRQTSWWINRVKRTHHDGLSKKLK